MTTISKQIVIAINEKRFVKIYRNYNDNELTCAGFILNYSEEFILIHNESDFFLDGFSILKISDIDKIRYGKFEKYFERMLNDEGISQLVGINYNIDLTSFNSIFESIKQNKTFVIAECEDQDNKDFIIGPIEETTKKSVKIRYFDATGFLMKNLTNLNFKNITTIQFDTRYVNYFSKYLRDKSNKNK